MEDTPSRGGARTAREQQLEEQNFLLQTQLSKLQLVLKGHEKRLAAANQEISRLQAENTRLEWIVRQQQQPQQQQHTASRSNSNGEDARPYDFRGFPSTSAQGYAGAQQPAYQPSSCSHYHMAQQPTPNQTITVAPGATHPSASQPLQYAAGLDATRIEEEILLLQRKLDSARLKLELSEQVQQQPEVEPWASPQPASPTGRGFYVSPGDRGYRAPTARAVAFSPSLCSPGRKASAYRLQPDAGVRKANCKSISPSRRHRLRPITNELSFSQGFGGGSNSSRARQQQLGRHKVNQKVVNLLHSGLPTVLGTR